MERPVPVATSVSAEYWRRTAAGELALQWCLRCGSWVHYPRGACPRCYSPELEFRPTSGQGWIYSYSIVHTAGGFPSYADLVPYVVVLVELREGPRLNAAAADSVVPGDRAAGREFFFGAGQCASCHMVYGAGAPVGAASRSPSSRSIVSR